MIDALIYGTASLAERLDSEIAQHGGPFKVRAFVCEKPVDSKHDDGRVDQNLVATLVAHPAQTILIALEHPAGPQITRILAACAPFDIECRIVSGDCANLPRMSALSRLRRVELPDIVGPALSGNSDAVLEAGIKNRRILVTGAGGSIGSELCKRIARFSPARIIAFDQAESGLFELGFALRSQFPGLEFAQEIGSIQNVHRLRELFRHHSPECVLHAAAYKHVPFMESHPFEAVENNVLGTNAVARAALQNGVEDFVLISTDKAVSPCSMLGLSKRISELLVCQLNSGPTRFMAIRFGNVVGSTGSVSQVFEKQIMAGGPITVTHPQSQRFFMTIPQACRSILHCTANRRAGTICVARTAENMLVTELARRMLLLHRRSLFEVPIEYIGLRPGERLQESLLSADQDRTLDNDGEHTFVVPAVRVDIGRSLAHLAKACESRNVNELLDGIRPLVPEFTPSTELVSR